MSDLNTFPLDEWVQSDGLLYRLNEAGVNCDEINVTQANGSRSPTSRGARAMQLFALLTGPGDATRYRTLKFLLFAELNGDEEVLRLAENTLGDEPPITPEDFDRRVDELGKSIAGLMAEVSRAAVADAAVG
jgi:hypothetical protein